MRTLLKSGFLLLFIFLVLPCRSQQQINTGPGPEDMVIDTLSCYPRLLIAVCSRRAGMKKYGEIEEYHLAQGTTKILVRKGEPAGIEFRPHGIFLAEIQEGLFLYVISHEKESNKELIIRYKLEVDHLQFDRIYASHLIISPNALTVFKDGSFLVCNDAGKPGNRMEQIMGLKRASIIFCDGKESYSTVAERLGMPAGINHRGNAVYLSCATENKVYRFRFEKGQLTDKEVLCRLKGPDNIRLDGQDLIVACHLKTMKFVRHINHPELPSPSTIYRISPETGDKKVLFSDSGGLISAASVGLVYLKSLFIGQIFGAGIVRTSL